MAPSPLNIFIVKWWKTVAFTLFPHPPLGAHTYWKLEVHQSTPQFLFSNHCSLPFLNNCCSLKIHFCHKHHLFPAHDRWCRSVIFWLQDDFPSSLMTLASYCLTQPLLCLLKGGIDTDNLSRFQGRAWPFQRKWLLVPLYFCHLLIDITIPCSFTGKSSSFNA